MNKRIRKKHAKQAWERMQKEIRDPAFWQRTNRRSFAWLFVQRVAWSFVQEQDMQIIRVQDDTPLLPLGGRKAQVWTGDTPP